MTLRFTSLALVLLLAVVTSGQTKRQGISGDQIKEQVRATHHRINEASLRGDVEELNRLMSDDFIGVGTRGEITGNKASLLAQVRAGRLKITYHKDRLLAVKLDGIKVLVTGEALTRGEFDGQTFALRYTFADSFMKRAGEWQTVLSRVIRIIR